MPPELCDTCTSTHYSLLMDELKDKWKTNTTLDRDLIHLFSGKDLEPLGVVGAGIEPGINNETHYAYSLSQHIDLSDYARSIVVAHEIGHNFNGKEDLAERFWNPLDERWEHTIMWPAVFDGDPINHSYAFFSDGTRETPANATRNNVEPMIDFACAHLPKD